MQSAILIDVLGIKKRAAIEESTLIKRIDCSAFPIKPVHQRSSKIHVILSHSDLRPFTNLVGTTSPLIAYCNNSKYITQNRNHVRHKQPPHPVPRSSQNRLRGRSGESEGNGHRYVLRRRRRAPFTTSTYPIQQNAPSLSKSKIQNSTTHHHERTHIMPAVLIVPKPKAKSKSKSKIPVAKPTN
jgi:hypothetical protein